MRRAFAGIVLSLLVWTLPVGAAELRPFTADSLSVIKAQYAGRPFILSLWSVNWCGHCITELTMLGKVAAELDARGTQAKTQQKLPLVLVSTDTPESTPALQSTLKRLGLERVDSWVFDDAIPERVRHAVDPGWYGELPRTYLYNARHQREAVTGVLSEKALKDWLKNNNLFQGKTRDEE